MISDFEVLERVLGEVQAVTRMAVLHREPDVASHAVSSDVDACIAGDPLLVLASIVPRLEAAGVRTILTFYYDRGSYSFFFSNAEATGGAQVGPLHAPHGAARYGVATTPLLEHSRDGVRWPCLDPLDE